MTQRLRLFGGSDPLRIDAVDSTSSDNFTSLLFSGEFRSLRAWMIATGTIGGNLKWEAAAPGDVGATDHWVQVAYGKTFPTPPLITGLYQGNVTLWTEITGTIVEGQDGGFAISREDQVYLANLGRNSITMKVLVFDLPADG